jgi:hypothetical protein
MTKKDYIQLAKIIRVNSTTEIVNNGCVVYNTSKQYLDKDMFISDLCSILKSDNSNFDIEKFKIACK